MPTRRLLLTGLLTAPLAGCGLVLYPERQGQGRGSGRLDAGVVLLDGLLVLVGIIPGIIAFAIDVSSGCIHVPAGAPDAQAGLQRHRVPRGRQRDYERALTRLAGQPVSLDDPALRWVVEEQAVTAGDLERLRRHGAALVPPTAVAFVEDGDGRLVAARAS